MKVKISYTVDFDDIPKEVARLLRENGTRAKSITDLLVCSFNELSAFSPENKDPTKTFKHLEMIREKLMEIDLNIQDSISILKAYQEQQASQILMENSKGEENFNEEEKEKKKE